MNTVKMVKKLIAETLIDGAIYYFLIYAILLLTGTYNQANHYAAIIMSACLAVAKMTLRKIYESVYEDVQRV